MKERLVVGIEKDQSSMYFPELRSVKVDTNDVIDWLGFIAHKDQYHVTADLVERNIIVEKTNSPRWMYAGVGKLIAFITYISLIEMIEKLRKVIAGLISFGKISELAFPLNRNTRGVMLHRHDSKLGGMLVWRYIISSRIIDKKSGNMIIFDSADDLKPFWDPVLFVPRRYITVWYEDKITDKKGFQKYIASLSLEELNMYADFINELVESGFVDKQQLNEIIVKVIRGSENSENMLLLASLLN